MSQSHSKAISRSALRLADGMFGYAVDLGLWMTIYFAEISLPAARSGKVWKAKREADSFLQHINYDVIKNALQTARKRGLVKLTERHANPQITQEGKKRLSEILPHYDDVRAWDNAIHIITYDIPEEHKKDREILRGYLLKIRCARLQDSVWVTPYNPIDLIRTFREERTLHGMIIVSDMGKDGSIGEENLPQLIQQIFGLESLNNRYKAWLESYEHVSHVDFLAVTKYLAILKDDPQLPFSLLPSWWVGDKAYQRVKGVLEIVVNKYAIA